MTNPEMTELHYRKKPVVIEAVVWDGSNYDEVGDFLSQCSTMQIGDDFIIKTLEGDMRAAIGDYIIKGVKGEFYPCKPDIFAATYEPASAQSATQEVERQYDDMYAGIAEKHRYAKSEFEDKILEFGLNWEDTFTDPYDGSVEFVGAVPGSKLSPEAIAFLRAEKFERCWVNFTDGSEDYYSLKDDACTHRKEGLRHRIAQPSPPAQEQGATDEVAAHGVSGYETPPAIKDDKAKVLHYHYVRYLADGYDSVHCMEKAIAAMNTGDATSKGHELSEDEAVHIMADAYQKECKTDNVANDFIWMPALAAAYRALKQAEAGE